MSEVKNMDAGSAAVKTDKKPAKKPAPKKKRTKWCERRAWAPAC